MPILAVATVAVPSLLVQKSEHAVDGRVPPVIVVDLVQLEQGLAKIATAPLGGFP